MHKTCVKELYQHYKYLRGLKFSALNQAPKKFAATIFS